MRWRGTCRFTPNSRGGGGGGGWGACTDGSARLKLAAGLRGPQRCPLRRLACVSSAGSNTCTSRVGAPASAPHSAPGPPRLSLFPPPPHLAQRRIQKAVSEATPLLQAVSAEDGALQQGQGLQALLRGGAGEGVRRRVQVLRRRQGCGPSDFLDNRYRPPQHASTAPPGDKASGRGKAVGSPLLAPSTGAAPGAPGPPPPLRRGSRRAPPPGTRVPTCLREDKGDGGGSGKVGGWWVALSSFPPRSRRPPRSIGFLGDAWKDPSRRWVPGGPGARLGPTRRRVNTRRRKLQAALTHLLQVPA